MPMPKKLETLRLKPTQINLRKVLPFRSPFLLIDKMLRYKQDKEIVTEKYITGKEWFLKGHFPGNPVMPGHLIAEAMAQTCALFFKKAVEEKENKIFYLAASKTRFFRIAKPKDKLIIKAYPVRMFLKAGIFKAETYVKNKLVAKGEFSIAGIRP